MEEEGDSEAKRELRFFVKNEVPNEVDLGEVVAAIYAASERDRDWHSTGELLRATVEGLRK